MGEVVKGREGLHLGGEEQILRELPVHADCRLGAALDDRLFDLVGAFLVVGIDGGENILAGEGFAQAGAEAHLELGQELPADARRLGQVGRIEEFGDPGAHVVGVIGIAGGELGLEAGGGIGIDVAAELPGIDGFGLEAVVGLAGAFGSELGIAEAEAVGGAPVVLFSVVDRFAFEEGVPGDGVLPALFPVGEGGLVAKQGADQGMGPWRRRFGGVGRSLLRPGGGSEEDKNNNQFSHFNLLRANHNDKNLTKKTKLSPRHQATKEK
ncbi:MAG: hypothetical protein BWY77_00775 [bacterium ADurb.Bin431]|nr:MAG: hypothetical protein BWY77_00775 [bacterium ADurb.Bin431]